jgi:hypothetical protein
MALLQFYEPALAMGRASHVVEIIVVVDKGAYFGRRTAILT